MYPTPHPIRSIEMHDDGSPPHLARSADTSPDPFTWTAPDASAWAPLDASPWEMLPDADAWEVPDASAWEVPGWPD